MPLPIMSFTRSRIIVTMLRYEATAAVSDKRPRLGMTQVPPCPRSSATADPRMQLSRALTPSSAAPNAAPRGKKPEVAIFSCPPTFWGDALVLMMYRSGRGGAVELMTAFMYGLAHPQAPGQFGPKHRLGSGGVRLAVASCF